MPYEMKAGKPYRPSNAWEGMRFEDEWCDRCQCDAAFRAGTGDGCPILRDATAFDLEHPDYPKEWVHDEKGRPKCTAYVEAENG